MNNTRRVEALDKDGKKIALLKENLDGEWRVFQYSNRQTYAAQQGEIGWTEQQAKAFVIAGINANATFQERL